MRLLRPFVLAVALCGCYTYSPLKTSTPEPGQQLRVQLTLTGGDSLARFLGPNVASVDGRLVLANDEGFELGVTQVLMHSGSEQYWKGETVTLPKPYVASIQERSFSWGKTGLLAGVVVLVGVALQSAGAFGGSNPGGGPGNQQ
jgi:hypothetical protein